MSIIILRTKRMVFVESQISFFYQSLRLPRTIVSRNNNKNCMIIMQSLAKVISRQDYQRLTMLRTWCNMTNGSHSVLNSKFMNLLKMTKWTWEFKEINQSLIIRCWKEQKEQLIGFQINTVKKSGLLKLLLNSNKENWLKTTLTKSNSMKSCIHKPTNLSMVTEWKCSEMNTWYMKENHIECYISKTHIFTEVN